MNNPKNTRMCLICRKRLPKEELIKITYNGKKLIIDEDKSIEQRGLYICKNKECIEKLKKRKNTEMMFRNALNKRALEIDIDELVNLLESHKRG